jgi:cutinase
MFAHCRRSWQVGLGASALVIITAVGVLPGPAPVASAADCSDAEVVFARGTDEPPGMGRVGDALVDSLKKQAPSLNITTYAVDYKAGKLQLHGGDGAKDAIAHIKSTVGSCPDTKIVLGGYSQGASIVDIVAGIPVAGIKWGNAIPPELASHVAAVATFGDVADRAGGSLPSQSTLFAGKAVDLCNPGDPICHAGPGNSWSGHTEGYVPVYTTQAAAFVASKLLAGTGQSVPGFGPAQSYGPSDDYGSQQPGYGAQAPGYGPGYGTQAPGYDPGYGPSTPVYDPSQQGYGTQAPGYGPTQPSYGSTPGYGSTPPSYDPSTPSYDPSAPQYGPQPGYGSSSPDLGLVSAIH